MRDPVGEVSNYTNLWFLKTVREILNEQYIDPTLKLSFRIPSMMTRRRLVLDLLRIQVSFHGMQRHDTFSAWRNSSPHFKRQCSMDFSPFVYLCDEGQLIYQLELDGLDGAVT
jgi:hypothetical protein